MFNSQYYTCEQVDERLLQGYVDDFNEVNGTDYSKNELILKLFQAINWDQVFGKYEESPEFVRLYLDENKKVSDTTPAQAELVSLIVDEMKFDLLKK